jgi:Flp pilus assembly protein TadG
MFEFGRMIMVQQLLTNAARSGSRVAVIDGATASEAIARVETYLEGGSVDSESLTVTVNPSNLASTDTGDPITVQVSVPFEEVSWLPAPWFLGGRTLTASSTMRRE